MKEQGLKRIVIISPYPATQENLENLSRKYFGQDFKLFNRDVRYHKFGSIGESYTSRSQIGLGGEILVIYDQSLLPPEKHHSDSRIREYDLLKHLTALITESKRLCDSKGIPYFDYTGQIERKEERILIIELDKLRKQIYSRLELEDFFRP
jgi:hypothetical protein